MKFLFYIAGLAAGGLPIGYFFGVLRHGRRNKCKAVDDAGQPCKGGASSICIDGLCPHHCQELHENCI